VRFIPPEGGFARYIEECRARIARARARARWRAGDAAIEFSAPFERRPARPAPHPRAALLIHGLSDTPFQMRDLARVLTETHGFLSRAILLPGHGTAPGDLLRVTWEDWARAVRHGIECFRGETARLFAVGFSTGAALAIDAALEGAPLAALILISPAIALSPLAGISGWHRALTRVWPRAAWYELRADRDPFRYESLPHNAVYQVRELTRWNRLRWERQPLAQPMLVLQSEEDATVEAEATLRFFRAHQHAASRMVLYARAEAPDEVELDTEGDARIVRVRADDPALRAPGPPVLSFSHLALPYPPGHPHYGRLGSYRNCLHYDDGSNEAARRICRDERLFAASPAAAYGEKTLVGQGLVVRRLTWNPHFDGMATEIGAFLQRVG
jgi:alpha-beta hydrolase superfamily lysophospholipase